MTAAVPRTYPNGTTCWVETAQPDVDAAVAFYGELLGWRFTDRLPPDAPARFVVGTLDGEVAGAVVSVDDMAGADGNATWTTYVAADDLAATAAAVRSAGGTVLQDPTELGPAGALAVCRDPQGAIFRLWRAGRTTGVQIANVPGAWNFSDLHTTDPHAAMSFYAAVFGWQADLPIDASTSMIRVPGYGEHLAATSDPGIHERQAFAPPGFADVIGGVTTLDDGESPHWHVTMTVADRDAAAESARELGATVVSTSENEWTRQARVRDPQGATVTLSQFTPPG